AMEDAAARDGSAVLDMLKYIVVSAGPAVSRTQRENPTNRAAGVVDAGARGLQLVLEGVLSGFTGEQIPLSHIETVATKAAAAAAARSREAAYAGQLPVQRP